MTIIGDQDGLALLEVVWPDGAASVRLRGPNHGSDLVPAIGLELRYQVADNPKRYCLGHRSAAVGYVDCDQQPQPDERRCVGCAVAEAEWAGGLHHAHVRDRAELDAAVVRHLDQPNVLYLAAFRDGSVKVGTSTEHRTHQRLIEQGAWRAVVVATTGDGLVVRRVEDLVSTTLGLPQSVAVKRKVAGLVSPMDDRRLTARLAPLVGRVHELLASDPVLGQADVTPIEEPWSFPLADDAVWRRLHPYPARLDRGRHHVAVAAVSGRVAVLTRPGSSDRFAADLSPLFGIELDLGDHQPDELVVQDSLF